MANGKRAVGLDILKTIAALMIITLHYVGYSGNLPVGGASTYSLFSTANLIEAFCICGVNVFVIISCYISINSMKTDISGGIKRFISVWTQTIVVTIPLAIILLLTGITKFSVKDILSSVLPFSTRAYWFITTFMCFSLLLPFLNRSVKALSVSALLYLSCALVVIFCVIPTFFELFGWNDVQHGYSLAWFITLYYCTAFLVKSELYKKAPAWCYAVGYFVCSILLWVSVVVIGSIKPLSAYANYFLRNYASIPVFLQSFALVFTFLGLDFKISDTRKQSIPAFLASGSLMSYILHMHPLLKQFYTRIPIETAYPKSIPMFLLGCVVVSIGVYLVSVCVYHVLKRPINKVANWIANLFLKKIKSNI